MKYVISIKRTRNYLGAPLKNEEQYYEYASIDRYAGSFSTNYPTFDEYRPHAVEFESVDKALEWWTINKKFLTQPYVEGHNYDLSTLAIREEHVSYSLKKKLTVNKDKDWN